MSYEEGFGRMIWREMFYDYMGIEENWVFLCKYSELFLAIFFVSSSKGHHLESWRSDLLIFFHSFTGLGVINAKGV